MSDPVRRSSLVGFTVGFAAAFVVTILALLWRPAEVALPVLVPAAPLLRPVAQTLADWPGGLTMLVAGGLNGVVYAVVAALAAVVIGRRRARGTRAGP